MIKFPENAKKHLHGVLCNLGPFALHYIKKHLLRYVNFSEACRLVCNLTHTNSPP